MHIHHDLVLLDIDGTISDPLVGIGRSINYALSHFGYSPLALEQLAVHVGPPLDHTFKAITGVQSQTELNRFVSKYRERYAEVGYSENVLYPGISEALSFLGTAGIPLGVCTSKRIDFAEKILEMFGLRSHFQFVNGGEIGIQKWQQIEDLLTQGKVTTSSVMVGDRAVDVIAAHRNGLQAAGVLWGHGSRAELENEHPTYLLASTEELSSLVWTKPCKAHRSASLKGESNQII
jgi:phosphoglycolate phosphatase